MSDDLPVWDARLAKDLLDCEVLVGITHRTKATESHEQFFGFVEIADPKRGVLLRLEGKRKGEHYWLPPDLRNFRRAKPGKYRLRSTGEVVIDPDFTTEWTVDHKPAVN